MTARGENIVDLSEHRRTVSGSFGTSAATSNLSAEQRYYYSNDESVFDTGGVRGVLGAAVLRRIDPDASIARLLDVTTGAISKTESCMQLLQERDYFNADDMLMSVKQSLAELFMFRNGRDGLGLVVSTAIQAISGNLAITDSPDLPRTIHSALLKLYARPNLKFEEAIEVSDAIEQACGRDGVVPGYNDLAAALIDDVSGTDA
jgi:hypothetical protein